MDLSLENQLEKAATLAALYMTQGHCCSEATVRALLETLHGQADPLCLRIATPFRGGMARTHKSTCGVVSGGLIVIGSLFGRALPTEVDDLCSTYAARYYESFEQQWGLNSVNCGILLEHRPSDSCIPYAVYGVQQVLKIIHQA